MSDFISHQTSFEDQSSQQSSKLDSVLQKLASKALDYSKSALNQELALNIEGKYHQLVIKGEKIVDFLEYLIFSFLNQIERLQQSTKLNICLEDYSVLEEAVQKSEAEIRKHIRIEQQLKIYLDSLQQKSEQLYKRLAVEQQKYSNLYECMRQLEEQRKELLSKVLKIQQRRMQKSQSKQKNKSSSNCNIINPQFYKDYLGSRKTKLNKAKHVIDKLNAKKLSQKRQSSNLKIIDGSIQINLSNNIIVNKKRSYDEYLARPQITSHNSSIKELTKTVQMKQVNVSHIQQRAARKVSKYKTETGEHNQKKEHRANSVCN